jgi:hypothetical protein
LIVVDGRLWLGDFRPTFGSDSQSGTLLAFYHPSLFEGRLRRFSGFPRLPRNYATRKSCDNDQPPVGVSPPIGPLEGCVPGWRVATGFGLICFAFILFIVAVRKDNGWMALFCVVPFIIGSFIWLTGHYWCEEGQRSEYRQVFPHNYEIVPQNYLDKHIYRGTLII